MSKAAKADAEASAAEWVPIETIAEWAMNPRRHGKGVAAIMKSLRTYGWGAPILVRRETMTIVAGHGRFAAAKSLREKWVNSSERTKGRWSADAVRVGRDGLVLARVLDLSESQAAQLAVADNRIAQESEWDDDKLRDLMTEWADEGFDISTLGFDSAEIEKILGEFSDDAEKGAKVDSGDQGFAVVIECDDENQQIEVIDLCQEKDWKCRALI